MTSRYHGQEEYGDQTNNKLGTSREDREIWETRERLCRRLVWKGTERRTIAMSLRDIVVRSRPSRGRLEKREKVLRFSAEIRKVGLSQPIASQLEELGRARNGSRLPRETLRNLREIALGWGGSENRTGDRVELGKLLEDRANDLLEQKIGKKRSPRMKEIFTKPEN